MDSEPAKPEREVFTRHLRDALTHLYDPEHLGKSPLAAAFGVADRYDILIALHTDHCPPASVGTFLVPLFEESERRAADRLT